MGLSLGRTLWFLAAFALSGFGAVAEPGAEALRHGIAMHGEPALPPGFPHFPYVNPEAPKGGRITLGLQGTFDSLNPLIVLGVAPNAVPVYVLQSLMARSADEPFTLYGLVARSVELPQDRSFITFHLDPRARFSDGRPLTAEDVRFTFDLLKKHGKPFHRTSFAQAKAVEILDPHRIRFDLSGSQDRELPLIIALMPIFPAHATNQDGFDKPSLAPPIGSGPYTIAEVKPGERVVLKRRQDYWAEDLPVTRGLYNFEEIRYDFFRDANSLFEAFKAGLYDVRLEGDPTRWATGYDIPPVRSGRLVREALPLHLPKGMNGFVFNTRRPIFADPKVREALGYLFDFEWLNRNLFSGLLKRSDSFFAGSVLASTGRPATERERMLLGPFPGAVRDDLLEGRWAPPVSDGSGRDRDLARRALALLNEAGWSLEKGVLRRQGTGEPFVFEILVNGNSSNQERLGLNLVQALEKLGIQGRIRSVDEIQYWRRLGRFDFDMIQWVWPASDSPGSEQRNRWGSSAAQRSGSQNFAGVQSPAIDRLLDSLLEAETREDFVASVRALDRALLSGFYVIPLFYADDQWLVRSSHLKRPATVPLRGVSVDTWWREPD